MNILVVCQHYYPENFQITPICEELVKRGHKVTALVGLPNYPLGVVPEEYKKGHRDEYINGVHVIRCYERGRKKGAFNLALNYLSFYLSSNLKIFKIKNDFDVVFSYQLSPITMSLAAKRFSKIHKVPMALYCCDLWPESMKMYIKNEKNPLFVFMKYISKKVYNYANVVMCQSESFIDYLHNTHDVPLNKLKYVPAFADESYLKEDFKYDNGIVDFVFLGNIGIAQNINKVLEAVNKIKDIPNFKLHIVGDGTSLNDAKEYVKKHNLENFVEFYGRRPVEEMPKYYKLADACLVSLKADSAVGLTLPAKVQGYMAAGLPIIGMIDGSAKKVIEEARCGICVSSDDVNGLAKAMEDFIDNNKKYSECGKNSRDYFIKNFTKDIIINKIERNIEQ